MSGFLWMWTLLVQLVSGALVVGREVGAEDSEASTAIMIHRTNALRSDLELPAGIVIHPFVTPQVQERPGGSRQAAAEAAHAEAQPLPGHTGDTSRADQQQLEGAKSARGPKPGPCASGMYTWTHVRSLRPCFYSCFPTLQLGHSP
jgi:hypothetical protein